VEKHLVVSVGTEVYNVTLTPTHVMSLYPQQTKFFLCISAFSSIEVKHCFLCISAFSSVEVKHCFLCISAFSSIEVKHCFLCISAFSSIKVKHCFR